MNSYDHFIKKAKQGDWIELSEFILRSEPEHAYEAIKFVGYGLNPIQDLKKVVDIKIRYPLLCSGLLFILAKKIRNGKMPSAMTEKESDFYTIALEESHDLIQSEISINSQSGLAATIFMSLAIDPLYEGMKDDAESILRNANNVPISGFLNLLIAKCEKWGGSHDEMFSVVTQFYDEDRPGSAALVARALRKVIVYGSF
jgi:hypothetical protein